ncbi:uncharacterized protein LOC134814408 isoform X1 [Bolinopsis microptera]|uniref:uncharacterized protein LOC134814408 isoform X1 n=1 Tax=Bolinopsis microptera TaxID=2820187 RepID=UPI003079F5F9
MDKMEDEEDEQFLLVEDDRMEDVIILSEPSSDTEFNEEQDLVSTDRAAIIGTLELTSDPVKIDYPESDHVIEEWSEDHDISAPNQRGQEDRLNRSTSESSVDTGCQTEEARSYTEAIVENVVQGTYAGGMCILDGGSNILKSLNIGTAPGNFTGTLKEDITQTATHWYGVIKHYGKELSLERIKYKLFM